MKKLLAVNPMIPFMLLNNSHNSGSSSLPIMSLSYFQFYVLIVLSALFSFAIIRSFWEKGDWFWRIILIIVGIFLATLMTFLLGFVSIDLFNSIKLS